MIDKSFYDIRLDVNPYIRFTIISYLDSISLLRLVSKVRMDLLTS